MAKDPYSDPLARYAAWEESTRALCEMGERANALLTLVYASSKEDDLFEGSSPEAAEFVRLTRPREEYWLTGGRAAARAKAWVEEIARAAESALAANDRLGLFRQVAWAKLSTLPIVRRASMELGLPGSTVAELERRIARDMASFLSLEKATSNAIHLHRKFQSSDGFLRRNGKKNFVNLYRIERAGEKAPRFVELVESWQLGSAGQITLCLPIGIGCPNTCRMCDLGTYYGGNLSAAEMLRLIELNLGANGEIPTGPGSTLTIYYLGGGDAALNPELPEVLEKTSALRPGARQIVSTIGLDVDGGLERLVRRIAAIPGSGFQISLCSLDDEARSHLISGNKKALTVRDCLGELERFADLSGRRGYASIFLVDGLCSDVEAIADSARRLVNREKIHLTLTLLRENELPLSTSGAPKEDYERLAEILRRDGFDVSISTNDEDPENNVSCGCMESDIIQNNIHFRKSQFVRTPSLLRTAEKET